MKNNLKEIKEFGLIMCQVLFLVATVLLIKSLPKEFIIAKSIKVIFIISILFFIISFVAPLLLKPIYIIWMKFADILGNIMTNFILSLTFFVVITPIAVLLRIVGKKFLEVKIDKSSKTYWIDKPENLSNETLTKQF